MLNKLKFWKTPQIEISVTKANDSLAIKEKEKFVYLAIKNAAFKENIAFFLCEEVGASRDYTDYVKLGASVFDSGYGASANYCITEDISNISIANIGHGWVLDLKGNSIGTMYLHITSFTAVSIIKDIGLSHPTSDTMLLASVKDFQERVEEKDRDSTKFEPIFMYNEQFLARTIKLLQTKQ